jgi:iron complex outermembrane receptor protein
MFLRLKTFFVPLTFGVCVGIAGPANAQNPPAATLGQLETVISTARQRQEELKDIPVAATAFTPQALERYAIDDLQKVAQATPQMIIGNGSSGAGPVLYIRGVGSNGGSAGFDPAVGIVIDGVFYSRGRFVMQGFFDMEGVEVLKGPQALYYGKNNSAGLISMRTANPGDSFEAMARVGYEFEADEIMSEAVVSGPLSDKFGIRLAVRYSDMKGWMRNDAGPQIGVDPLGFDLPGTAHPRSPGEEELLGRLTMRWTPTDNLEAIVKVNGARNSDNSRIIGSQLSICNGPGGRPQPIFGVEDPFEDCKQNFRQSLGDYPADMLAAEPPEFGGDGKLFSKYKALAISGNVTYTADKFTLTSVTGYIDFKTRYFSNADFSATGQIPFFESEKYSAFSQEFRLLTTFDGPVNFLVGAYYQDVDFTFRNSSKVAPLPPDPATGRYFTWDKNSVTGGKTWSAYAEAIWNISDQIELAGGARYTKETKKALFTPSYIHGFLVAAGVFDPRQISNRFSDDNISPQVTLTWRPTDEWTLFGAYKTGFKSGGIDASHIPGAGFDDADLVFKSEEAEGFEVGAKASLLGDRLRTNLTAYYYTFDNLQVQQLNPITTVFFIGNAAKARTQGIEWDFDWLVADPLTLRGALAYNKGRYVEFFASCYSGQTVEQGCTEDVNPASGLPTTHDRSGEQRVRSPDWYASLGFTYEFPVLNGWMAAISADGIYSSGYGLDEQGTPGGRQKHYVTLDANLRLIEAKEHWELSLIGRNLTNEPIATFGNARPLTGGTAGLPEGAPGAGLPSDFSVGVQRGRQIMLQVTYRFR